MDGIIEVKVNGYSISKDSSIAGTQYESKSTKLRITFAENWDGYAKKITFWNALGENAVVIQLGTNLLEDILVSDSVYIVPIAGEAMTEAGEFNFVIEGIDNGVVKRTVGDKLRVLPSPKASNAGQAQDVTPTQAEQIRAEIDSVIEDIADAKEAAVEAHEAVEEVRNMSVSCETLGVGETPTVEKSIEDDIVNLHFGIPTSEEGIHIGAEAPTEPFVKVWIDTEGEEDTEYVTRGEMEAAIAPVDYKAETSFAEVNNLYSFLGDKADKNDLDEALLRQQSDIISYTDLKYAQKTDLSDYATKEDLKSIDPSSDLNLQNGWGLDSLVQKTSYEDKEGAQSTADGIGSFSTGRWNRASADCSVALNYNNNVTGKWALACGYGHTVSGSGGFASGAKNTVGEGGIAATATGTTCKASGRYSFVGGNNSEAAHESSFVAGHFLRSTNAYTAAFGKFNDFSNGKNIFTIGFGANENSRANVLALNREGILEIKPSYIAPAGAEARLKLGNTTISESQLITMLGITPDTLNNLSMEISNWAWTEIEKRVKPEDLKDASVAWANEANSAYSADHALRADYDSEWNDIKTTYATKDELKAQLGDIEAALDELHAYAQARIGGAE